MAEPQFAGFPAIVIPTWSHAEMSSIWRKGLSRTSCLDEVHQSCCTMVATELVGDCLVVENGGWVRPYIVLKHKKNQTTFKTITRAMINNNDHNMLKFESLGYIFKSTQKWKCDKIIENDPCIISLFVNLHSFVHLWCAKYCVLESSSVHACVCPVLGKFSQCSSSSLYTAEFSLCAHWGNQVFTDWTNELPQHIFHWQNRKLLLTACKLSCWSTVPWHAGRRSDSRCCRDSHALCNPLCQNWPSDQAVWQLCGIQATIACKVGTTENKEMGGVSKRKSNL